MARPDVFADILLNAVVLIALCGLASIVPIAYTHTGGQGDTNVALPCFSGQLVSYVEVAQVSIFNTAAVTYTG